MSGVLIDLSKDVREGSRYDTSVSVPLSTTCDCEGFTGSSLSVRKDGAIISLEATFDYIFGHFVENWFLTSKHIQNTVELEPVVLLPSL